MPYGRAAVGGLHYQVVVLRGRCWCSRKQNACVVLALDPVAQEDFDEFQIQFVAVFIQSIDSLNRFVELMEQPGIINADVGVRML